MQISNKLYNGGSLLLMTLTLLLCGNSGCKKDPENVYIGAELNSWFNYKTGSYWIMIDSATGKPDSIYCYGIVTKSSYGDSKHQYESKEIAFNDFIPNTDTILGGFGLTMQAWSDHDHSKVEGNGSSYDPFLDIPYKNSGASTANGHPGSRDEVLSILFSPTMNIGGQSFDSVFQLNYTYPNGDPTECWYINRRIGFLKIVRNNSVIKKTLSLQRWNVMHK